jgi:hypothetical protein
MSNRVNVKPLMHWLIYRGYTVRITQRAATHVEGIMTTPDGAISFRYDPVTQTVSLPEKTVTINEYGWEIEPQ